MKLLLPIAAPDQEILYVKPFVSPPTVIVPSKPPKGSGTQDVGSVLETKLITGEALTITLVDALGLTQPFTVMIQLYVPL